MFLGPSPPFQCKHAKQLHPRSQSRCESEGMSIAGELFRLLEWSDQMALRLVELHWLIELFRGVFLFFVIR